MHSPILHKKNHIIFAVIAVAICFASLSVFLFLKQAKNHAHQTAGKVILVSESEVIISNRKGEEITLMVTEVTKLRDVNAELQPGMFIHSFGSWVATSTFTSSEIRVVKK